MVKLFVYLAESENGLDWSTVLDEAGN